MNNQVYGLCKQCIINFNTDIQSYTSNICQKCNQFEADFIVQQKIICIKCYIKHNDKKNVLMNLKTNSQNYNKKEEYVQNNKIQLNKLSEQSIMNNLILITKKQLLSSSFLIQNHKIIKKIQKILTQKDIKSNQIINYLNKKTQVSSFTWQKITQKCNKSSNIIYFFINKQHIFGAFHTQSIKIGQYSFIEDNQSGVFITKRNQSNNLNFYKTTKNIVKYSQKNKSISFGQPSAFQIQFQTKQSIIKSQLNMNNFNYQHVFVCKM